jgi:acyl-coenzyme A synthetase/AMP-(fatty) acid ligase
MRSSTSGRTASRISCPAFADELIAYCRSRIANYKCPRTVDFADDLPRHETGKIYKRLLRQLYAGTSPGTSSTEP